MINKFKIFFIACLIEIEFCHALLLDRRQLMAWFPSLNSLIWVDIAYKQIESIENSTFVADEDQTFLNLERLWIFNNKLTLLDDMIFSGLANLYELDISFNSLTHLSANIFAHLNRLQTLDLQGNQLTSIDRQVFVGLVNLGSVFLGLNPISYTQASFVKQLCSSNSKCTIYL